MRLVDWIRTSGFCLFLSQFAVAGPGAGGGGKSIRCKADPNNGFQTTDVYSVDYAVEIKNSDEWYVVSDDPLQHVKAVADVFRSKLSSYFWNREAERMVLFSTNFDRIWKEFEFRLEPTDDLPSGLPKNCAPRTQKQVTTKMDDIYQTFPAYARELQDSGFKQWSSHLIHEMVRQIESNPNVIARWNRVVHSRRFFESDSAELAQYLHDNGLLSYQRMVAGRVFDRINHLPTHPNCKIPEAQYVRLVQPIFERRERLKEPTLKFLNGLKVVAKADRCHFIRSNYGDVRRMIDDSRAANDEFEGINQAFARAQFFFGPRCSDGLIDLAILQSIGKNSSVFSIEATDFDAIFRSCSI